MQSTKPYLIRALHEWCIDQGFTPYLAVVVDAMTRAPIEFIKNGEIVFNIGLDATNQLQLGNDEITFQGRFGGKIFPVIVPVTRVAGIYARENGEGMAFEVTESVPAAAPAVPGVTVSPPSVSPSVSPVVADSAIKSPKLFTVESEPRDKNEPGKKNPLVSATVVGSTENKASDISTEASVDASAQAAAATPTATPNRPALTRIK